MATVKLSNNMLIEMLMCVVTLRYVPIQVLSSEKMLLGLWVQFDPKSDLNHAMTSD